MERARSSICWSKGGRYKLGWSGNTDGIGEVGILVKELCEKLQKSVEKVTE